MTTALGRALAPALAVVLSACSTAGGFSADERIQMRSPAELESVTLPFRLAWTASDLPEGFDRFAVFLDRAPLAPGRSLRSLADAACKQRPGCPDAAYLRLQQVFLTRRPVVDIPAVPILSGASSRSSRPVHTATVVLIDEAGHRLGGAGDAVAFRVQQ